MRKKFYEETVIVDHLDHTYFENTIFDKGIFLENDIKDDLVFQNCYIKTVEAAGPVWIDGNFKIKNCIIEDRMNFLLSIRGNLEISNSILLEGLIITDTIIDGDFMIMKSIINKENNINNLFDRKYGYNQIIGTISIVSCCL
ncbi:hypothetical protein [Jiulongibacter sediminis]|uniref:hypothetical protein n=1 Tax=Jiulongibacter sediminis TaxID=1605367 RepID=UPI0026EF76B2|nr:hypothetical protein [Jiulongibacter sediminis]